MVARAVSPSGLHDLIDAARGSRGENRGTSRLVLPLKSRGPDDAVDQRAK